MTTLSTSKYQPTKSQKLYVETLEKLGAPKFTGMTAMEAGDYIGRHKHLSEDREMTDKQWKLIVRIEEALGVCFEGWTVKEARNFISAHIEDLKKHRAPLPKTFINNMLSDQV